MATSNHSSSNGALVYRYYAQTGGWRFVVLFHRGRKWLRVLETARFDVHGLKTADADKLRPARPAHPFATGALQAAGNDLPEESCRGGVCGAGEPLTIL